MSTRLRTWFALLLLSAAIVSGCRDDGHRQQATISAFGTLVEITARDTDTARFEQVAAAIDREFQAMHRRWHAWEPGLLDDINQAIAEGRSLQLPPEVARLIEQARRLERASEGLFNPAIGGLLELWGFHTDEPAEGPPPKAEAIARLVAQAPSLNDLSIDQGRISSRNRAVQLDFGAFVKGHAVEQALAMLAADGIEHAIVNAGGDVGVLGRRRQGRWRVGIRHPDGRGGRLLAGLEVDSGEFVFTSGNYLRYRAIDGIRRGHIIDPRSGYPADQVVSVTVIHRRGAEADAAATALAVAGAGEWPRLAAALGVRDVLRVDADGTVWMTPGMQERIRFVEQPVRIEIRSLPDA